MKRVTVAVELRSPNVMSPLQAVVAPPLSETVHLRDGGSSLVAAASPPKVQTVSVFGIDSPI